MESHASIIINLVAVALMGLLLWIFKKMQGKLVSAEGCGQMQAECRGKINTFLAGESEKRLNIEGDMSELKKDFKEKFASVEGQIKTLQASQQRNKDELMGEIASIKESISELRVELKQDMIEILQKKRLPIDLKKKGRAGKKEN